MCYDMCYDTVPEALHFRALSQNCQLKILELTRRICHS